MFGGIVLVLFFKATCAYIFLYIYIYIHTHTHTHISYEYNSVHIYIEYLKYTRLSTVDSRKN